MMERPTREIPTKLLRAATKLLRAAISRALEDRAVAILREHGPMRGSDLGWELWGAACTSGGEGSHGHNKFCRPAGKLLRRLERQGRVIWMPKERCTVWVAI